MSVSVGVLTIDLQAQTASFVSGMDKAGQIALTSTKNIKKAFDAMGAGVIAALTSVEAAVAAMVDNSLENMARLADMSQSTGVATEALSALEYAAKQSGVSTESLDGALEKMAKSMEKAAASGTSGSNAYKTLGVAVTDSNGKLRPTVDIMEDLAQKFASFKDGPEKTALAMQIFGRAGAEMVPLLNRGKDGIADLVAEATKLGLVIGADDAAAAKQFEESMNRLEGAAKGAANRLTTEMLPALQKLMANMRTSADDSTTLFNQLAQVIPTVGKAFIVAFGFVQTMLDELESHIKQFGAETVTVFEMVQKETLALRNGEFSKMAQIMKESSAVLGQIEHDGAAERTKIWQEYTNGVAEFWNAKVTKLATPGSKDKPDAPATPNASAGKERETIAKRIADLQKQAAAEIAVAAAQRQDTAATIEAIAAAQSKEFIDKANADLAQKKAGHLSSSQIASVKAAEAEKAFATVANEVNKSLAETALKTGEQTSAVDAMAAAYSKGGAAIAQAQEAAQIAPFQKKVDDLSAAFDRLKVTNPGATQAIKAMSTALDQAKAELAAVKAAFDAYDDAQRRANTDRLATDTERQIASTQDYTEALLKGVDALRQYDINQKLLDYHNNPAFDQSAEAVQKYRRQLEDLYAAQDMRAAVDKVHSTDHQSDLNKEITLLQQLRAQVAQTGASTLAIDAAIHNAEVQRRQDLNNQLLTTNSVKNGFKVFFDQYTHDGITSSQRVNQALTSTFSSFNSTLTNFITTGKGDWQSFASSAIGNIIQMGIQWVEQHTIMSAAQKIFHVQAAADDAAAMAQKSAQNVALAASEAAVAAAGQFAYYSAIAPELAPVMAAAAYTEGLAWSPVAAFREGGIVPGDGNDGIPALLHPREMVLPERVAKTVTDNVRSGGDGSGGKSMTVNYNPVIQGNADEDLLHQKFEIWTKAEFRKRGLRF